MKIKVIGKKVTVILGIYASLLVFSYANVNAGVLDPLELHEIEKVKQIQLSYIKKNLPEVLTNSSIEIEVLLIEKHSVAKGEENTAPRWADIYTYDYGSNILHKAIVSLETNKLLSLVQNTKVQLPLTQNETQKAIKILMGDEEQFQLILSEYQLITGKPYTNSDQINIKAFAFWGNSLPGVSNTESLKCGVHRCAQILIHTPEMVAFEVSPIVDLSTKKITQNIKF
ncbi:MAG: hypothetical protein KAH20_14525 [Methylococcales bacterium]|nr:hypothetical protein [Methylococcales bacterium]